MFANTLSLKGETVCQCNSVFSPENSIALTEAKPKLLCGKTV